MNKRSVLAIGAVMVIWFVQARGAMEKVELEQLVTRSHTIVVGRVTDIRSAFEDEDRRQIVTLVTVSTSTTVKGNTVGSFMLTLPGGIVGEIGQWVEHIPSFAIGEEALLFVCNDYKGRLTVTEWHQGKYTVAGGSTFVDGLEVTVQSLVSGIKDFISRAETGKIHIEQNKPVRDKPGTGGTEAVPSITYISPPTGSAIRPYAINPNDPFNPGDRGKIIDIYGSGFGSTQGSGVVRFYETPSDIADSEDYLLWSNTHITCKVPGRQAEMIGPSYTFRNASSGLIYVVTSGGTSNGVQFTVTFASPSKKFSSMPVSYHANQNGTPDTDGEFQAIQDGFQTWENVSNSNLDFTYVGTTTRTPTSGDGYNDCGWIESNWPFQGAIAVNSWRFNLSASDNQILEFDIFFNGQDYLWTTTGDPNRRDVQNLATHESGHSLNLQDIYGNADVAKTMYGYGAAGETSKRTLELEDISGCVYTYPNPYSLSLFNTFEFDGTSGGQVTVRNISQATNTITYSAPQNRTVYYNTAFEFGGLSQQTINSRDYRFISWTDGVQSLSRSVTVTNPVTLSPNYKGHLLSSNVAVTTSNNQKKIGRDNSGTYHVVYESGDKIWYSSSTDNGVNWSTEEQLFPSGYPSAFPSIATHSNFIYVVWQDYEGVVNGMHQYRIRGAWKEPGYPWEIIITDENMIARFATQTDPLPSLAAADNTANEIYPWTTNPELMVAWRNSDGIYSAVGHWDIIGSQVYRWREDIRFGLVAGTNGSSLRPSVGTDFLSRVALAYEEAGKIYAKLNDGAGWSSRETVSSTQVYDQEYHKTPSVTVDNSSRPIVSWEFFNGEVQKSWIYVRRRETSGTWGVVTGFLGIPIGNPSSFYNYAPSVSGYPRYNNDYAVAFYTSQGNAQLRKNTSGAWENAQIVANPGFNPILSLNNSQSLNARIAYRNNSSSPYGLGFTWPPPQSFPGVEDEVVYRQIKVEGDSFCVSYKIGEISKNYGSTKDDVKFYGFRDTLVLRGMPDIDRAIVTDSFSVTSTSDLELYAELEVDGSEWILNNWRSSSEITLALTAVDVISGEPIADIATYTITRARIPSFQGYLSVPLSRFIDRTIRIEVNGFTTEDLGVNPFAVDEHVPASGELTKSLESASLGLPSAISLAQNYPNPFNPTTTIEYELPIDSRVTLQLYDLLGKEVLSLVDGHMQAGYHHVSLDATNMATGMYFYKLTAGSFTAVKKLLLIK